MGKYVYILALVLASWVLFGNNAMSDTPDGETPAQESVCDGEVGAAYGLCVSYCEAMDCGDGNRSSEQACDRVRENYEDIVGTGKPFPCECPCNFSLTTACLADEIYTTRVLLMEVSPSTKEADTKLVMSSIMTKDADAVEIIEQDVMVKIDGHGDFDLTDSSCKVFIRGSNTCVKEAREHSKEIAEDGSGIAQLKNDTVINACQTSFAQYAQDAIANGVLAERQAVKSDAIIGTLP